MTIAIPLDRLHAHPGNCNKVSPKEFLKLQEHIKSTGQYPPLIVRAHPTIDGEFQLLDGHYRRHILDKLGHQHAECCVWQCTDDHALVLLLTLNRLNGVDDPRKRGRLMQQIAATMTIDELTKILPDNKQRIQRLIDLNQPPPSLTAPTDPALIPNAVTFFLTPPQEAALDLLLKPLNSDPSQALIKLLDLSTNDHLCVEPDKKTDPPLTTDHENGQSQPDKPATTNDRSQTEPPLK